MNETKEHSTILIKKTQDFCIEKTNDNDNKHFGEQNIKTIKTILLDKIFQLYNLYKNDNYIIHYLYDYLNVDLPNLLLLKSKQNEINISTNTITKEEDFFTNLFLHHNKFYYLPTTNCFYIYDSKNYSLIKEDDLHYKILVELTKSNDETLKKIKHKAKLHIINQIKEKRNLYSSIPETYTIQKILKFFSCFFNTKYETKYFLTIIGDIILKKNKNFIYLINNQFHILKDIQNIINYYICDTSINITNKFVNKYNKKYNYNLCRLIYIKNYNNKNYNSIKFINDNALNLICVATHYSTRFIDSVNFINYDYVDNDFKNYTLFLSNKNENDIIDFFIKECLEYIETDKDNCNIENQKIKLNTDNLYIHWKDIIFIWKTFLNKNNYPNIMYLKTLKDNLILKINYNFENDIFYNITSHYLPIIKNFLLFWNSTIIYSPNINDFTYEIEINEIYILYKKWWKQNGDINLTTNNTINENDILKIIRHYFKNISIIDNKYFINIYSTLWDKNKDIDLILNIYKIKNKNKHKITKYESINIDDIYLFYIKYYNLLNKFTSSKNYFERYIYYKLEKYIEYDNFISIHWLYS